MSQEMIKFNDTNAKSLENSSNIKEEFQDDYYPDNKVCFSETTITDMNINNGELNEYIKNDKIRNYEMLSIDHVKTYLPSSEVNNAVSNNVKIEDGINPADIQIEFCNELRFCDHCHEVYEDYCIKCRVLVHILNRRSRNSFSKIKELPECMLETRESIGHLGIFSLKVIPENVRFGPFTGLTSTGVTLKIKGGKFVVDNDKAEHLNWMQYINPARNIFEQNLFPFRYEDKLYFCSTRRIQEGEELLVYFGEKYEDNLVKNVKMDFIPIKKKDVENVFACTFCCLGFSSKEYLVEHKAVTHSEANKVFLIEELVQCPFCKIYLEGKEYFEHHMDYCCETNDRNCALPTAELHELEMERRKIKRKKPRIYECTQCKFRKMYSVDCRHHSSGHYQVKMYKCGICHRRYNTKKSLTAHMEENHADNEGRDDKKYSTCDYFKERSIHFHDGEKQQTENKRHLKSNVQVKHLNRGKYKCANCEFKTYYRTYLERHMKLKHLIKCNYACAECEFKTNYKSNLRVHKKTKHLKKYDCKCAVSIQDKLQTKF